MRIVFLHPDLGIGGAERLVCDAALGRYRAGRQLYFLLFATKMCAIFYPEAH